MAYHKTKGPDGEVLIENDEEYYGRKKRERKQSGCLTIIGILVVLAAWLAFGDDDKKESTPSQAKTEQKVVANPETKQTPKDQPVNLVQNNEPIAEQEVETKETSQSERKPKSNTVIPSNEVITESDNAASSPTTNEEASLSPKQVKTAIESMYQNAMKYVDEGNADFAQKYLTEMEKLQSQLSEPNTTVNKRIESLKKAIEKMKK